MAASLSLSPDGGTEINFKETVQELYHQLAESKRQLRKVNEKLVLSEATAYSLANQLQEYECGEHQTIIESVLGKKLQHKEEELPERLMLAKQLRESNHQIQDQALEISHLRKKLQQGRELSSLIYDFLKDLIAQEGSDCHKEEHLRELLLAEGLRLAEYLVCKLSPENCDDKDNGKEQESPDPRLNKEEQEEVKEALHGSLDEGHETLCSHCDLPDIHRPPCSSAHLLESEDNQKEEKEEECLDASLELQEDKEIEEEPIHSLDEMYLVHSICNDFSDSPQPPESAASLSEEHMDVASYHENDEEKTPFYETNEQDRDFNFLLEVQARDLANLKLKVQEGRDASLDIKRHLEDLLTQPDPDCHRGQDLEEHLVEGCRLAEHLAEKLSPGDQEEQHKEEKELPESQATRKYYFLVQAQARGLTHLRQQLKKGSDVAFSLVHHLTSLLSHESSGNHQHQSFRDQLSEICRLAERLLHRLRQDHDDDETDEEELESLDSSLESELQEKKEKELLPDECYYVTSGHPDSSDSQGLRSTVLPSDEPRVNPAGSKNLENKDDKDQDPLNSSPSGELQEEKEHDPLPDEESSPPSGHPESAHSQGLLQSSLLPSEEPAVSSAVDAAKLNLDASIPMKNHAKIEGDALKRSSDSTCGFQEHVLNDATGDWKQKIMRRKVLFSKWRIACRFPGIQASEMDSDAPPGIKNSPELKGDAPDGAFPDEHGCHVRGCINGYAALREQIGEGKRLVQKTLSLLRPTCNFLGLEAQSSEDDSMELKLSNLRALVSKEKRLLESTDKGLKTAKEQTDIMQKLIIRHQLDSDAPPGIKNSPELKGDAPDGAFPKEHGCPVGGRINGYAALREQIGEGKRLVQKTLSLLRPTCNFLGLEAQSSEDDSMELKLSNLRALVSKEKRLLESTDKGLKTAKEQMDIMQKLIIRHREILKGPVVCSCLETCAFLEPHKKQSHHQSLKNKEA